MSVQIDYCLVSRMGRWARVLRGGRQPLRRDPVTGVWGRVVALSPGAPVKVTGRMATENGMRVLKDAQMTPLTARPCRPASSRACQPDRILNKDVGDLKNLGLLVTVWGRVISTSGEQLRDLRRQSERRAQDHVPRHRLVPSGGRVKVTGISTADGVAVYRAADIVSFGH